ncbi:hypothetical protein OTK49_00080 [Vibrio coralliirubri]|uniref:hypothetical protein n=1 Tax=Vibrio coralliirubri TaxID=1516159 RepID=UPI0022845EAF|nr:hypothetical protein [Vibrio coralliirubri]MCY9860937.1 hypothetical protein [Vibrio coralliirubri]
MNLSNILILTPANKIPEWREIIRKTMASGKNVIWVGDTETTGTEPKGDRNNKDLKDRLLEVAMMAFEGVGTSITKPLLDSEGNQIFFHEYVNPFIEDERVLTRYNSIRDIPYSAYRIHGIDKQFLEGKAGLKDSNLVETDFRLPTPARTFYEIKPALEWLTCADLCNELKGRACFLAHNCKFDAEFMDCEFIKCEFMHDGNSAFASFESYFMLIDSLALIKEMYSRSEIGAVLKHHIAAKLAVKEKEGNRVPIGHSLEFLRYFYEADEIKRDVHGALIDTVILAEVYKQMVNDDRYKQLPMIKNQIRAPLEMQPIDENGLIVL